MKKIGKNTATVSSKELGTNCWATCRFIPGKRCLRVLTCTYPEKKTCEAVKAELAYLRERCKQLTEEIQNSIRQTQNSIRQLEMP
ncbi:MAG: hypothetical protein KAR06_02785 [Deltaproteobacteria bacterium]|nr:hypothetical protein [Deltaproteobacteria bacterium]